MSISNIGGVIYTNQNTPVAAHLQQSEQSKLFAQNLVAAQMLAEKEKKIEETKPTKQTHQVKPQKEDKEPKEQNKKKKKEPPFDENEDGDEILDIKV